MTQGIHVEPPGCPALHITELLLDFTGTLSLDGTLLPGVAERLTALSQLLRITVLTADTFGTAREQLQSLPVEIHLIRTGRDKAEFMQRFKMENLAAMGNGRNDCDMLRLAGLGVAVLGPEGCAADLLAAADVVCRDIRDALDLLSNPLRLKATLRE